MQVRTCVSRADLMRELHLSTVKMVGLAEAARSLPDEDAQQLWADVAECAEEIRACLLETLRETRRQLIESN